MQIRLSPSMRSITISSNNGFGLDLTKVKGAAARHVSYRTLFYTVLALACLLPFVFILTAIMTLEGFNKCSSLGELWFRFRSVSLRSVGDVVDLYWRLLVSIGIGDFRFCSLDWGILVLIGI